MLLRTGDANWEIAGSLPLHELENLTRQSLQEEGITTVSGWVTHKLEGFPKAGEILKVGPYELRVDQMEGMKVAKLILIRREGA